MLSIINTEFRQWSGIALPLNKDDIVKQSLQESRRRLGDSVASEALTVKTASRGIGRTGSWGELISAGEVRMAGTSGGPCDHRPTIMVDPSRPVHLLWFPGGRIYSGNSFGPSQPLQIHQTTFGP